MPQSLRHQRLKRKQLVASAKLEQESWLVTSPQTAALPGQIMSYSGGSGEGHDDLI